VKSGELLPDRGKLIDVSQSLVLRAHEAEPGFFEDARALGTIQGRVVHDAFDVGALAKDAYQLAHRLGRDASFASTMRCYSASRACAAMLQTSPPRAPPTGRLASKPSVK
jgi:hypothetical protein